MDLHRKNLICEFKETDSVWKALYSHGLKGFLRALQWNLNVEQEKLKNKADLDSMEKDLSEELIDMLRYHLDHGGTIDQSPED